MGRPHLRGLVVGAAAGGGFPQWNCSCANCAAFWRGEPGYTAMTQSSFAASADGACWTLINASPDLRAQIIAQPALHPRPGSTRHSPIVSVILTNGDLDHIAGLLTLREKHPLRLLATGEILSVIEANPVFNALDRDFVRFEQIAVGAAFEPTPGLTARLFHTPGKTPLFMEGDGPVDTAVVGDQTVGVELSVGGETLFYIPGCARLSPELATRLRGADTVLFDGTVFHDDEMIRAGAGSKTGARMGHMAMAGPQGSLKAFEALGVRRKIYVHINNTNPVLRPDGPERAQVYAAGWEIARDGLMVEVERKPG